MVRRMEELKSISELGLSAETETYLANRFSSLAEVIFEGRIEAYDEAYDAVAGEKVSKREKHMLELADALDRAGFIRHDIDRVSFYICRLYARISNIDIGSTIPGRLRDFSIVDDNGGISDCALGNEKYEKFVDPKDNLNGIRFVIKGALSEREAAIVMCRFGLEDGRIHHLEDLAKRFGISPARVRQLECRAIRNLRRCQLPKMMIFSKEASCCGGDYRSDDICWLGLSTRVYYSLRRYAGIYTIDDIIKFPREQWPKIKRLGRRSMEEVQEKVRAAGFEDFDILS